LFALSPAAAGEQDNLSPVGSPIVLQRRGSVYGANVPMITGMSALELMNIPIIWDMMPSILVYGYQCGNYIVVQELP
jgi:hypothetical protein